MSLGRKVFAAPARLWMNWPLWGGLLAMLLLTKHVWVLFAPAEHAVPGTAGAAIVWAMMLSGGAILQLNSLIVDVGMVRE